MYVCMYICAGCLNIYKTHIADNNCTNYNVVFFLALDLKIVYYNNYGGVPVV